MTPVRFNCPRCNRSFPILFQEHRFACPECGSRYHLLHSRHGFEWAPDLTGPAWQTQEIRPVSEGFIFPEKEIHLEGANLGEARMRQIQRQSSRKSHRRTAALVLLSLILAIVYMLTPLASPVMQAIASSAENWLQNPEPPSEPPAYLSVLPTAAPTLIPTTARPSPTPTSTPVPATPTLAPTSTPIPSATPLPLDLLIATAWQATVDQAVVESHTIQTANALQWSTTQTALPPILTALSEERALIATQTAEARSTAQH